MLQRSGWPFGSLADWAMVVVGFLTAVAAFITLRRIKDEIQISAQAAAASERAATATAEAVQMNRAEFIATHRPRIVLRNVDLPDIERGGYPGGTIWATNVGDTVAHVIKFEAQWFTGEHLPMRNPFARTEPTQTLIKEIAPGVSQPFDLPEIADREDQASATHAAIHQEPERAAPTLYLIGVVKYRDDNGQLRRTGFCRRYDRKTRRFRVVDDLDYEHVD